MKNSGKALNENSLRELALRYVGRYATTRHKLTAYLRRKIAERGWDGEQPAGIEPLVDRLSELKYVDDAEFARMRAQALIRKGYGKRRVSQALFQAGIKGEDEEEAMALTEQNRRKAADTLARKKSIGPYAAEQAERDVLRKQLQAFLRAGHDYEIARQFVYAKPGALPDEI